ncbi:MAG: gamma-glutamylcyclotransferase family protein [Cyclobacteriaceae bacterium]
MQDQYVYIFSYGSNLLLQRIRERVPSVVVVGLHKLKGYQLMFNKQSIDGSTKASIAVASIEKTVVWGVIHKISQADKPILDEYEALGKGYDHMTFDLEVEGGRQTIYAYMATDPQYLTKGKPYDWHLNFVIAGAIENEFPRAYIEKLRDIASATDPDITRQRVNEATLERSRAQQ